MALSIDQIFDASMTLQLQRAQHAHHVGASPILLAPAAPAGYQLIGTSHPLSRDAEGSWIGYAYHVAYNTPGMLVYDEESQPITFFTADEAMRVAFVVLDTMMDLVDECSPSFLQEHMQTSYALWQSWSRIHAPQADIRLCVFCWQEANPGEDFPAEESSKYCERHRHLVRPAAVITSIDSMTPKKLSSLLSSIISHIRQLLFSSSSSSSALVADANRKTAV